MKTVFLLLAMCAFMAAAYVPRDRRALPDSAATSNFQNTVNDGSASAAVINSSSTEAGPHEKISAGNGTANVGSSTTTTTTSTTTKKPIICAPRTPCGWGIYLSPSDLDESTFKNTYCECSPEMECMVDEEDLLTQSYVFRCKVPPPEPVEATNSTTSATTTAASG